MQSPQNGRRHSGMSRNGSFEANKTHEDYEKFKKEALDTALVRSEIKLADLEIVSEKTVKYQGTYFEMTEDAFQGLIRLCGLNKEAASNFADAFGSQTRIQLLDTLRTALSVKENRSSATIVLNTRTKAVVDIRREASSVLANSTMLGLFEDVMGAQKNMRIKRMALSSNGSIEITAVNDNWAFQIAKLKNEFFHSGLAFINQPHQSIVSPFNERLTCTNGTVYSEKGLSLILKSSSATAVSGFIGQVRQIAGMQEFEEKFKARVIRMMKTVASYAEMKHVYENVLYHLVVDDTEVRRLVDSFIPIKEVQAAYLGAGIEIESNRAMWKRADTNMTVWELVGVLTDLSSHPERYALALKGGDQAVFSLQKQAGQICFKKEYDREYEVPELFDTKTRIDHEFRDEAHSRGFGLDAEESGPSVNDLIL